MCEGAGPLLEVGAAVRPVRRGPRSARAASRWPTSLRFRAPDRTLTVRRSPHGGARRRRRARHRSGPAPSSAPDHSLTGRGHRHHRHHRGPLAAAGTAAPVILANSSRSRPDAPTFHQDQRGWLHNYVETGIGMGTTVAVARSQRVRRRRAAAAAPRPPRARGRRGRRGSNAGRPVGDLHPQPRRRWPAAGFAHDRRARRWPRPTWSSSRCRTAQSGRDRRAAAAGRCRSSTSAPTSGSSTPRPGQRYYGGAARRHLDLRAARAARASARDRRRRAGSPTPAATPTAIDPGARPAARRGPGRARRRRRRRRVRHVAAPAGRRRRTCSAAR